MERKDLKSYEAPACEVVEVSVQGILCASPDLVSGEEKKIKA